MVKIPTCLVTSIGEYQLFEPIIVESADVGLPQKKFSAENGFGYVAANLYRSSHQLLTIALALSFGTYQTRNENETLNTDILKTIFGEPNNWLMDGNESTGFTAATAIMLGEKLEDGKRKATVVCGPENITPADSSYWSVHGGNLIPDQVIPATGSILPTEQRVFYNQGIPMRTISDSGEAANAWQELCGFDKTLAQHIANTLRWNVPDEGEGLALPVFSNGSYTLVFPGENVFGQSKCSDEPVEYKRYNGPDCQSNLPGLIPYQKTGF